MSRYRFSCALVTFLMLCSVAGARATGAEGAGPPAVPQAAELKGPRPGPDFPALESYYPPQAKRAGQQGATIIRFCVDSVGKLTAPPSVTTSSGNPTIDSGAVNLATAASGHYLPAFKNGVAVPACSQFKIKFELRGTVGLPLDYSRYPTISARITALDAQYGSRMKELVDKAGPLTPPFIAPDNPELPRMIRQYARSLESRLDEDGRLLPNDGR